MVWREVETVMDDPRSTVEDTTRIIRKLKKELVRKADRHLAIGLVAQWVVATALALLGMHFAWYGGPKLTVDHFAIVALGGWVITGLSLAIWGLWPQTSVSGYGITVSQALFAGLLAGSCGAEGAAHVYAFAALVVLTCYRDRKVLLVATGVLFLNHVVRGLLLPGSGFGAVANWTEALVHTGWLVAALGTMDWIVRQNQEDMHNIANRDARLDILFQTAVASENSARASFEQAAVGMCYASTTGNIIRVNCQFCEITGYSPLDLAGRKLTDITHPEDRELQAERAEQLASGEIHYYSLEERYIHKEGHDVWVCVSVSLVRCGEEGPNSKYQMVVVRDITEAKNDRQKASEYYEQVKKLSLVAAKTKNPVLILGADGCAEWANAAFTVLTEYEVDDVLGRRPSDLLRGPGTDASLAARIDAKIRRGEPVSEELLYYSKAQRPFWADIEIHPVHDESGELTNLLATYSDITERLRYTQQLLKAKSSAEAASRAMLKAKGAAEKANLSKSQFLANMSHEIRTPLNGIIGFSELLVTTPDIDPEEAQAHLHTIRNSGRHLLALVNDILDLSKIESSKMDLERTKFSPHHVLAEVISLTRVQANQKSLELNCEWSSDVPKTIEGDQARLRQVLLNLIGNAIKFTESGSVTVHANVERDATGIAQMNFAVQDTGIGIAKENWGKIFKPFSQEDETVTRRFGGTGLGLTISKRIAELLGGDLTVESEPGKGSTFKMRFAAGKYDDLTLQPKPTSVQAVTKQDKPTEEWDLSHCHILLVDDGDTNRRLVKIILDRAGATVHEAENGLVACNLSRENEYDLILLDMQMPVMDGYTAASQMRDDGYDKPIVALTAHAMRSDQDKCLAAGCSEYLTKPLSRTDLLNKIAEVVPRPEGTEPPDGPKKTIKLDKQHADSPAMPAPQLATSSPGNSVVPATCVDQPMPLEDSYPCDLPTDDAEIREVVLEFVGGLPARIEKMQEAIAKEDVEQLRSLAHWLKGAGGTVGFDCFTQPAAKLEALARSGGQRESLEAYVSTLQGMSQKLVV